MAIYANMFSKKYIPESNIEEKILKENTIPLNINRGKEVDDNIRQIPPVYPWMPFTRGFKNILDVMGPLSNT